MHMCVKSKFNVSVLVLNGLVIQAGRNWPEGLDNRTCTDRVMTS